MGAYMGKEEFSDQGKRQQSLLHTPFGAACPRSAWQGQGLLCQQLSQRGRLATSRAI